MLLSTLLVLFAHSHLVACHECPGDSIHLSTSHKCYFIPEKSGDFVNCIHECSHKGASVAIPETKREVKLLAHRMIESASDRNFHSEDHGQSVLWLGIVRISPEKFTSRAFRRLDGKRLNYSLWDEGDPNNLENNQNCVVVYSRGVLDDFSCDRQGIYCLCQVEESSSSSSASNTPPRKSPKVIDKLVIQFVREKALFAGEIHELTNWVFLLIILDTLAAVILILMIKYNSHPCQSANST